jgi:hypothetical protein
VGLNGFAFIPSEAEAAQGVLELAAGTIDETGFALFLRDHTKRARKRAKCASIIARLGPQVLYFQSNKVLRSKDSCALST